MSPAHTKNPSPPEANADLRRQALSPQAGRGAFGVTRARNLRKKQTEAELKLWLALRDRRLAGVKFLRQIPIDRYVVDFVCRSAKLIVEVDGGQHDRHAAKDNVRSQKLAELGYRVIRFWNNDVFTNLDGVLPKLLQELGIDPVNPEAPSPRVSGERAGGEGPAFASGGEGPAGKETKPC